MTNERDFARICEPFYETEFEIWAGVGPVGITENFCNSGKAS